jgi:hypothetical protein
MTDTTDKLLPCPFCGCTDIDPEGVAFYPDGDASKGVHNAPACTNCSATAGHTVEEWNTRAPVTADTAGLVEALKNARSEFKAHWLIQDIDKALATTPDTRVPQPGREDTTENTKKSKCTVCGCEIPYTEGIGSRQCARHFGEDFN